MAEIFRANYENFFDLGKGERTYAWIGSDAAHELPLFEFRKGLMRLILKQWSRIKLERCSLSPWNEYPLFVCHECGFIFVISKSGFEEHHIFHAKHQKSQ